MFWNNFPLSKLFFPFLAGNLLAFCLPVDQNQTKSLCFFLFILILLFYLFRFESSYRYRYLLGLLVFPAFFLAGASLRRAEEDSIQRSELADTLIEQELIFVVRLVDEPQAKTNSWKVQAQLLGIIDSLPRVITPCEMILYLELDSLRPAPEYGDVFLVAGRIQKVAPVHNPGEFDYQSFLYRKGVLYQAFAKSDSYRIQQKDQANYLVSVAKRTRKYLMRQLAANGLSGQEFSVASAVLLGYDELLDAEQRKAFSGSGAMHVLCVSGLHVGIIYMIISMLVSRLSFLNRRKWFKALMILTFIWMYALITGLAPSVLRASAMFSFVVIGNSLGRRTHIYNSLLASAFLLVLINPMIIYAVGFQLSYLAVIGIVSLHPLVYSLWSPKRNLPDKIWSLVAVSIAAQLTTFPLAMHYFNQFPNYFIATNLIVIPLSTCILYCGILSCILIPVPYLNTAVTWLLSLLVKIMNASAVFIESMPGAVTRDVFLSEPSVLILYLLLICASLWIIQRKKKLVWTLPPLLILLLFLGITRKFHVADQHVICVYDNGRHPSIDFMNGREAVFLADSVLLADESKHGFHLSGHRIQQDIVKVEGKDLYVDSIFPPYVKKVQHLLEFKGFRMVLIDSVSASFRSDSLFPADALFITGNPYLRIDEIVNQYKPSLVLISSDNSIYQTKRWIPELDSLGVDYWDIREKGAWIHRF